MTKTPEQIAHETLDANLHMSNPDLRGGYDEADVLRLIIAAIEADRAQRDIPAQIAGILDGRGARSAAQLVRDTDPDDDLWNNYIGPMIDSIEDDYTKIAADMKEEH